MIADDTYAVRTWAEVKQDLELVVGTDIQAYSENNAFRTDKLSAFAATTSAELAGVISDEIGAGKLRFDTTVTAKTTTALLTEAEAGTILVSAAGGAYTVTLPTAVNNAGLTYHFIKTDANYTLITLAANGAETFNYENSTGAPVATYARLNTYCAEVTVVSDGSNWQCINERLGQVPMVSAYKDGGNQENIVNILWTVVDLDTEDLDIGNNFNMTTWISGTARATTANHLIDTTTNPFTAAMKGYRVKNTTDNTYAYITVYNSASDVTVSPDIFANTEGYLIKNAKFVAPIPGNYIITGLVSLENPVVDKRYGGQILKNNTTTMTSTNSHASVVGTLGCNIPTVIIPLAINDELVLRGYSYSGDNTVDIAGLYRLTSMTIYLVSKS